MIGGPPELKNEKPKKFNGETGLTVVSILLIAAILVMSFVFLPVGSGAVDEEIDGPLPSLEDIKRVSAVKELEGIFTTVDLMDATIEALQSEMAAGNLTSVQLTQMYIDRILAYDKSMDLNSVIAINPSALADANRLDEERAEGKVRGPLHGIPIVVKANIDVEGMATTAGAKILADMIAPEDSFVVKRLKDSGAVILAHANMSEFAYATASSRSTMGGITHNAYDTTRTPGGSSGGTGVAVTCNFAAAGVGTDTGGSIRNPSSLSNIYGLRPSKGLTSVSGILPLRTYKDVAGPMARTAEDMALLTQVMAGNDSGDDYTVEVNATALKGNGYLDELSEDALEGMRIGFLTYSFEYGRSGATDHVQELLDSTLETLSGAGAEIVDISDIITVEKVWSYDSGMYTETFEYDVNRYLAEKGDAAKYKTVREMFYSNFDGSLHMYLKNVTGGFAYFARSFENTRNPYTETVGNYQRVPGWSRMLEERAELTGLLEENDIDAVIYLNYFDVSKVEEPYITEPYNWGAYDIVFGPKHGLPEISLPMGFARTDPSHATELPLGLSVFTGFGREETLFRIAYAYEKQAGESIRRMPAITPALPDENLNAFLRELIFRAYDITDTDYDRAYAGLVQNMLDAVNRAEETDLNDPYAVYDAARTLAEAYDKVIDAIG
ncbi:MAG: hypothetical protein IJT40_04920 [Firmicutes bacterium]|nr:hypothetical protein [Bacillota bacterium]